MLKNLRQFAEFVIQPANWTSLIVFAGGILAIAMPENEQAIAFSGGWLLAALLAFAPSLFFSSWKNCSKTHITADRTLAYCEGWRRCLASWQETIKMSKDGATEDSVTESVNSNFQEGLAYVESGKHMRIS